MITKKQLKLLKQIKSKPRTVQWVKTKYSIDNPRDLLGGMFTLIHVTNAALPDDAVLTISKEGIIEIEAHQWF